MTIAAQSIIKEAQIMLNDEGGVYWPATELVEYLNDGLREAVTLRPDLFTVAAPLALVAGVKQAMPATCISFMGMPRNTNGAPISRADQNLLDAVEPSWRSKAGTLVIEHFCYDPREPKAFQVYPPAAVGASVDLLHSAMPTAIAAPGGAAWSTVTGDIPCSDVAKNPLIHWCLFRAFAKNTESAGNAAMSAAHYQLFGSGLVSDATTKQTVAPTS